MKIPPHSTRLAIASKRRSFLCGVRIPFWSSTNEKKSRLANCFKGSRLEHIWTERALLPHAFHGVETRIKRAKKESAGRSFSSWQRKRRVLCKPLKASRFEAKCQKITFPCGAHPPEVADARKRKPRREASKLPSYYQLFWQLGAHRRVSFVIKVSPC
jgi:hypothetical protein